MLPPHLRASICLGNVLVVGGAVCEAARICSTAQVQSSGFQRACAAEMELDGSVELIICDTIILWDVDEGVVGDAVSDAGQNSAKYHTDLDGQEAVKDGLPKSYKTQKGSKECP